jgi:hypothetical protein
MAAGHWWIVADPLPGRCRPVAIFASVFVDANRRKCLFLFGEPAGTRTQDHLIKSQVLYQLSYRLSAAVCRGATPGRSIVPGGIALRRFRLACVGQPNPVSRRRLPKHPRRRRRANAATRNRLLRPCGSHPRGRVAAQPSPCLLLHRSCLLSRLDPAARLGFS